jgi:hypothetical protein
MYHLHLQGRKFSRHYITEDGNSNGQSQWTRNLTLLLSWIARTLGLAGLNSVCGISVTHVIVLYRPMWLGPMRRTDLSPCSFTKLLREPGRPGWGSLKWDSKIWPWVLRDFDPRVTALARLRSNCTVNYRPVLSSERALHINKHATVWRKFAGERKIGRGSRMGAWLQDRLAHWLP